MQWCPTALGQDGKCGASIWMRGVIALYTPPVGGTLFVAAKLAKVGIGEISRNLWPLMSATFVIVLLVT